jgi:HK97 family phage major capsid protein
MSAITRFSVQTLRYAPVRQYAARGVYLMNRQTAGLCLTMSDASGRPIFSSYPSDGALGGGFAIAGSPVRIVAGMPSVEPGSTPVLFADLGELYLVVLRRALALQTDPYSAGRCVLFKMDMRVGGSVLCPGAGRLLRIR